MDQTSLSNTATPTFASCTVTGTLTLGTITITVGTGTPEGVVAANVGSIFIRTDGGVATTLYVKESGTGTTGWDGKD